MYRSINIVFKKEKGFFGKLSEKIQDVLLDKPEVDEEMLEELEEVLITSDIGMETTMKIVENLRMTIKDKWIREPIKAKDALRDIMAEIVEKEERQKLSDETPLVIFMIGINGGGKTTTIGKLAHRLKGEGKTVILAAADTFRAVAADQFKIWGERKIGRAHV